MPGSKTKLLRCHSEAKILFGG